jgi:hypothetical protein
MSEDVKKDHLEFREIVGEYSERLMSDFPSGAKHDWIVRCYCSLVEFERKYPTSDERDAGILHMKQMSEEARKSAKEFIKEWFHEDPETGEVLVGLEGSEMIRTRWVGDETSWFMRCFFWCRRMFRALFWRNKS